MTRAISSPKHALTHSPTPVFNTPEIASCFGGSDNNSLPLDDKGLMRTVETILFPGTKLQLLEHVETLSTWRIQTDAYPYPGNHFIDERFIKIENRAPSSRCTKLPSISAILKMMNSLEGSRYIWGGNWPQGIDLIAQLYPSKTALHHLPPLIQDTWLLRGVDCSGLLHYATDGWTPRNTSSLITLGQPVHIEGMSARELTSQLQPLDLIVWAGHVVCVLDHQTTIESRHPIGVIKLGSHERILEIMEEKKPVNDWASTQGPRFVVRRWHPYTNPRK